MTTTLTLRFGAMAPRIADQLAAQGVTMNPHTLRTLQNHADTLLDLYMDGVLTTGEVRRARTRIDQRIRDAARPTEARAA